MEFDESLLTVEERIGFSLRALYRDYGYALYRMSKFEEYDLYARNKDFLITDNVITFNDAGGRLMALKPDVTLSIVRATRDRTDGGVQKLCYNEHVYRAPHPGGSFQELTQVGLECIGSLGDREVAETLMLALLSLERVACGRDYTLNVSHLGVLSAFLDSLGLSGERRQTALELVARRSGHELDSLCRECGADRSAAQALQHLLRLPPDPAGALEVLRALCPPAGAASVAGLARVIEGLGDRVRLDFSIVSDMHYYNGVVFKGYLNGVPAAVLSGGQYDQLMRKLGHSARAIGFAVYVERLERVSGEERL